MTPHIRRFEEVSIATWDAWVASLTEATYLHSSWWLGFCHRLLPVTAALSFAIVDGEGGLLALCPFGVSEAELGERRFKEASWNGAPLGLPAVKRDRPAQRRRIIRDVFDLLHQEMKAQGVVRSVLRRHPISAGALEGGGLPIGQMEPLSAGYACMAQNTIIIDLSRPEEELESGMTHEQRKHIRRSERQALQVRAFRGADEELAAMHRLYQEAHERSAGRMTRPQQSFDFMLEVARREQATLFVACAKETPISFLYCGEFSQCAVGWSQANLDEFEEEFSPRHLLEWFAICSYRARRFRYYELGTRWYGPQLDKVPTQKELSISFFKERYGGELWPDLLFERWFDRELFRLQREERLQAFLASDYFEVNTAVATQA